MSLPFINCQHNPQGVLCELTRKRCELYPLVNKAAGRGIGKPIYKTTYCQARQPWPEGQGRKGVKIKREAE